jgi:hypothetical protein
VYRKNEFSQYDPNLVRGVFPQKVLPRDGHFALVRPAAAKLTRAARNDPSGLTKDEQFRHCALGKPFARTFRLSR